MKKMINRNIKRLTLVIVISMVAMLTWAMAYRHKQQQVRIKNHQFEIRNKKEHTYDPALLREFEQLATQLDFNKQHCTYSGIINVDDGMDTAASVHHIEFIFSRSGNNFYYRMGNTETIHQDGINLFIQHEQGKVVLSHNNMAVKSPVTDLGAIEKNLRYEDYDLVASHSNNRKKISILNPTHISCKELSMTYDTVSGRIEKIYTRFSNIADPLNRAKDRVFSIAINDVEDSGHLGQYTGMHDVLNGKDGDWRLRAKYANYELILL